VPCNGRSNDRKNVRKKYADAKDLRWQMLQSLNATKNAKRIAIQKSDCKEKCKENSQRC